MRNRIVWRRRRPNRAAGRLGWTGFFTVLVCGPAWLFFIDEPRLADDGAVNPLALVMPALVILFGALLLPQVLALIRRPILEADHYALTVRPGVVRILVMPWAQVAELAVVDVDDEPFLLVRCGQRRHRSGDWPRWWDQAHLRWARRGEASVSAYDLAVPMLEFTGDADDLLAELVQFAPSHVTIAGSDGW